PRDSSSRPCWTVSSSGPGESSASFGPTWPSASPTRTRRRSIAWSSTMSFRTALCDLLGIEYPIVQSGMGAIAGPELVAEVCRAGGLGILAGLNVPPDDLRKMIRRVRELTDRPFGVNLWLHRDLRPPIDPARISEATLSGAQAMLNRFRERLGIPTTTARPARAPDLLDATIQVVLEERPAVFSAALGWLDHRLSESCHRRGIKLVAMVSTVADARVAVAEGADVIVAQGGEAGGHRSIDGKPASAEASTVGTIALLPQVVDAVRVPVVAAGGFADGRGLVAALALGASGILLGTRFVATRESLAPELYKKRVLESESDATTLTDVLSGLWARALANRFTREYTEAGAPVLPPLVQRAAANDIYIAALKQGDAEHYPMMCGQSVGLIRDLPGAAEVIQAIVREARAVLQALPERVRQSSRRFAARPDFDVRRSSTVVPPTRPAQRRQTYSTSTGCPHSAWTRAVCRWTWREPHAASAPTTILSSRPLSVRTYSARGG